MNIRDFWEKYETKIVAFVGMILVAIISFEMGMIKGEKWQQKPLIIETPKETVAMCEGDDLNKKVLSSNKNAVNRSEKCLYVGSKNSDKYHDLDCHWAERIKEDNRVCFSSIKDAKNKGYLPGNCLN